MNKYGISEAKSTIGFKTYAVPNAVAKTTRSLRGVLLKGAVFVTAFSMVFSVFVPTNIGVARAATVNPVLAQVPDPKKEGEFLKNPTCADLDGVYGNGQTWSEVKIDSGALEDGSETKNGVTVNVATTKPGKPKEVMTFNWSSTVGIDAVLVKAGSENHNLYVYQPAGSESFSDTALSVSGNNAISHISFCYDPDPVTTKIKLIKEVSGGQADPNNWTLSATLQEEDTPAVIGTTGVEEEVEPGTYFLDETDDIDNYIGGTWDCADTADEEDIPVDDNEIVVEEGDHVVCTIVNTYSPDPEVPLLHFIKVVCDEYEDVVANVDADKEDDTGGKYNLLKPGPPEKPVSPDEIPGEEAGCYRADGWKFKLATDLPQNQNIKEVGPTTGGEFITPISGQGSALTEAQQEAIRDGQLWISEVEQPHYGFAAIRCYNDARNGDNLEYITLGDDNPKDIYCIAYNVPIDENPSTVDVTIIKYLDDSLATPETANNTAFRMQATWDAENIGAGSGTYELDADGFNGDPTPYQAITSQMTPGASYSTNEIYGSIVGETCDAGKPYTLEGYGVGDTLEAAVSDEPSLASPSFTDLQTDKFVIVRNLSCRPPVEEECESLDILDRLLSVVVDTEGVQCSISGYKYRDNNDNGEIDEGDDVLPGWEIYLNDGAGCSYDSEDPEPTDITDENGFYSFDNLPKGTYYVCERQQSGWDQVLPGPVVSYHTVVLTDSSATEVNFLNAISKDPCDIELDQGYDPESKNEQIYSVALVQYEYSVSGCKFEGDTDTRLAGWQMYVDLDHDGQFDEGEPTDTTDNQGYYKIYFNSGDYPLPYHVREVMQNGWEQTYPGGPDYRYNVYLGYQDKIATGLDFRNVELPDPCEEPATIDLVSGTTTQTAGSTITNPIGDPLVATSYEGSFGNSTAATTVIPPWVDPTTGSFAGSGAIWISTSTDHPGAGDEGSSTVDQWRLFQHQFTVPNASSIEESTLYFTADNAVTVYLNGSLLSQTPVSTYGLNPFPVDANFDDTYSVNFTPVEGSNTLSFVVRNSGGEYGPSNPTGLLYATSVTYTPDCDETPPGGGGSSGGGGGSRRNNDDNGRVLGDSTGLPYQAPQVLGATTELPRTGTPIAILFSLFGILAIIMIPKFAEVKR